jgi:hypothetical protein
LRRNPHSIAKLSFEEIILMALLINQSKINYEWEQPQIVLNNNQLKLKAPKRPKPHHFGDYPEFKQPNLLWNASFFVENCATTSNGFYGK